MVTKRFLAATLFVIAFTGCAKGQETLVSLKDQGHGATTLEGHFFVDAPASFVWSVLTDYDHISDFVSSMEQSRVMRRSNGELLVEQTASGRFFLFARSVTVVLNTQEKPYERIEFEDISHKDFDLYKGSWKIEETAEGRLVLYALSVKSRIAAPGFIKRRVVQKSVAELLSQVKSEIQRRASGKPAEPAR